MKKICSLFVAFCLLGILCGCRPAASSDTPESTSESVAQPAASKPENTGFSAPQPSALPSGEKKLVDLTALSSTMVYAEVYYMMTTPQEYVGKTVKMQGQFEVYDANPANELGYVYYFAVVIADATACCQEGIEFVLADETAVFPDNYPQAGTEITVVGRFEPYVESGTTYYHLVDATIE